MTSKVTDFTARAPLEPLLTVEDLERLLRVDRRTVARLCKRGQLPQPLKVGGGNRWKAEEIADAIEMLRSRQVCPQMEELGGVPITLPNVWGCSTVAGRCCPQVRHSLVTVPHGRP
jgi:predicted DNA-binding transcriptional regulator AlpA